MKRLLFFWLVTLLSLSIANAQITGDTSVCAGSEIAYNVPVLPGASYSWSITGGSFIGPSNLDNATINWGTPGVGTIVVTVNPPSGPAIYYTQNITINPTPEPEITHDPYPSCPPDTSRTQGSAGLGGEVIICEKVCDSSVVTYTTPLNTGSTYLWVVTGELSVSGVTSNTVTVMWDSSAFGSLTVYETNSFGCIDSATLCIEKVDPPVAAFTSQSSVCLETGVPFVNNSTGAESYFWDFGDGSTSSAEEPVHSYTSPGSYTITLVAQNECFCTDTFQRVIEVDSFPGPEISCPSTICAFDTVSYTATGGAGCTFNWFAIGGTITGGMGTPEVTIAWGPGAVGTLGLYLSGCSGVCTDTTFINIPIVPAVATISGEPIVCPGSCETYSLPHFSGAVYNWSLSSGCGEISDTTHCEMVEICWSEFLFSCTDTLTVSYYDSFLNCGGTAQYLIDLRPPLQVFGNAEVCANSLATLNANVSCNWSVSPPGPIISGSPGTGVTIDWNDTPGTYVIKAIATDPTEVCTDSVTYLMNVVATPPAPVIIGDTLVCPNSTGVYCAPGSGDNVNWIISGGTPVSSISNCITVNWGAAGPYLVQAFEQLGESPFCNSDTTSFVVLEYVPVPPVVSGPDTVCANSTSMFTNTIVYPPDASFTWSISPDNAGGILSPNASGTDIEWGNNAPSGVTVTLSVQVCGSTLTATKDVWITPVPTPTIEQLDPLCEGGTSQLTVLGGSYTTVTWSGPSFSGTGDTVTISNDGLYEVDVTDASGCTGSSQIIVSYVSGPTASISTADYTVYCEDSAYSVDICALGNPDYIYTWSPTGATTQCITTVTDGSFMVTVTDTTNGCFSVSNVIEITEQPCTGGGSGSGGCTPNGFIDFTHSGCNPVSFVNTSSVNASNLSWNFGDGNTSTVVNPTHTYSMAGFYLVSLTGDIPDVNGTDTCTITDTAHIEVPLAANFDLVAGCLGDSVCFTDKSTYTAGNSITSWLWNFGDGGNSTLPDPCHVYTTPGTYYISLTISNGTCTTTHLDTLIFDPLTTAAFTSTNPSCVNNPVLFTDASFVDIDAWSWNFGDGGTSLNQNPTHTYGSPGSYTVTLAVENAMGCVDTVTNTQMVVSPSLSGDIVAYPDTIVCVGTSVLLVAPSCGGCTYSWNNGSVNDSIVVTTTGIYTVTMDDGSGCPYTTFIRIIVNTAPTAIIKNEGSNELCEGENISLSTTHNSNWTYEWFTTDVINDGSTSFSVFYPSPSSGVYTYQLVITDTTTGCADTSLPYTVTVNAPPVAPSINALGSSVVCSGDTIILVGSHPDPTVDLLWSTGEVSDTIFVTENGCYKLFATDTNGCKSSADFCATVNPLPELCAFYVGCFDTCAPYTIQGPIGGASYQWLYNGTPIAGATSEDYTADSSGAYSVIVTTDLGCIDTTGYLELNLTDCDSLCADLTIDSVHCDSQGNYVMWYNVINHSDHDVSLVNLQILPPHLSVPFAPASVYTTVGMGDTSGALSTTIYGAEEGDTLCFRTHVDAFDTSGQEIMCCFTDSACVVLPPCDTSCCRFDLISDTIWCEQTSAGPKYNFDLVVDGCGTLQITSANTGILNVTNPYMLINGINTISGSYIGAAGETELCLTFTVTEDQLPCKDTTICFPIHCNQHPLPCEWEFKPTVCVGHSANFYYTGGGGVTINWTFPGGTPGTATGPGPHSVLYPTVGTYPVTMTMTNMLGTTTCEDSITVLAGPVASITQTGNTLNALPAGMSYQWYTGSPWSLIFGASNQYYLPDSAGYFCVVVTDRNGCQDTACIQNHYVGIEQWGLIDWNVYPNPNSGAFTVSIDLWSQEEISLSILNTLGEVVDKQLLKTQIGSNAFPITNTDLVSGIYFVQLKSDKGTDVKRILVE